VLLAMLLLSAMLNSRWARDGLTAKDSAFALLAAGELLQITGRKRFDRAAALMAKCARTTAQEEMMHVVTVRRGQVDVTCPAGQGAVWDRAVPECCRPAVEYATKFEQALDNFVVVHRPKHPEFQELRERETPKPGLETPPPQTQDGDAPANANRDEDRKGSDAAKAASPPPSSSGSPEEHVPSPDAPLTEYPDDLLDRDFAAQLAAPDGNPWAEQLDPAEVHCWVYQTFHRGFRENDTRRSVKPRMRAWWMNEHLDVSGEEREPEAVLQDACDWFDNVCQSRQRALDTARA
jgi:hypothetical protein